MALTDEQKAWADSHVGTLTTIADGNVIDYVENEDGSVTFHVGWVAFPPPSPEQIAAQEAARAAEEAAAEQARQEAEAAAQKAAEEAAAQAAEAERERLKALVVEVLAEHNGTTPAE